jgi:hypothetical protein
MTDEPMIGDWVTRTKRGLPHLVESVVAGDVITKCGRRLSNEPTKTGGGLMLSVRTAGFGIWKCASCSRKAVPVTSSEAHL